MANKTNSTSNFFETLVDVQQKAMDTMVENTKKFTNGNAIVNETIDKSTDFFKKSVETTKENIQKVNAQTTTNQEELKQSADKWNGYFENWKNQQTNWAKQMQEMNTNFLKGMMSPNSYSNPMNEFQNMWSKMNNMSSSLDMNQWMNPSNFQTQMDKSNEQLKAFWSQFQNIFQNNYAEMTKNFQNGTLNDTFKGMFNMSEGFSKFYEMWMPMMKSMQDKSFNMDVFTKNFDLSKYKEFMDNFFSFMPNGTQEYFNNMKDMYMKNSKDGVAQANEMMNSMKTSFQNMMPGMQANPYATMLHGYNTFYNQMSNAVTPFAKLMTPNNDTKTMQEWVNIINSMNIYNIKNAELQHMVYEAGLKSIEKLAQSTMHKLEHGEDVSSMMKMYQEYLNVSDKMYVDLFETDAYSSLMAEVSAMKMSIKKAVETQMEKSFVNIPVATRSEMDEVYQTIYDLKKQVRTLQAQLENKSSAPAKKAPEAKVAPAVPAKKATPAKKSTTKRK